MVALQLGDELSIQPAADDNSTYDLSFTPQCPRKLTVDWPIEKDLCVRAHRLLEQHTGRSLPIHLTLRKTVPSGGGLGGGSSDAAFTLIALNQFFQLQLDAPALINLALQLGSDVPFFITVAQGQPSSLVTGLGETLQPLPMRHALSMVLIFPDFGTPTGQVYQAFDRTLASPDRQPDAQRIRQLAAQPLLPHDAPFNDLAEPACDVTPALRQVREQVQSLAPYRVHVTGSGSTLFVLTPDDHTAQSLAEKIRTTLHLATLPTRTLVFR